MAKKHKAPPGIDYNPITGEDRNISYGVTEADAGGGLRRRTLEDVIFKRFFPTDKPDRTLPWPQPTAEKWEILLNPGAPDEFDDAQQLCRAYHRNDRGAIQHLAAVATIRHPQTQALAPHPQMKLHEAWSLGRALAGWLSREFSTVVVAVFHNPARSWGHGYAHSHLVVPLRAVRGGSFGQFVMPLVNGEEGRAIIDREWKRILEAAGYGQ